MGDTAAIAVAASASPGNVVFCRGLSFKATESDVRGMLADCGDILSVSMPVDARARPSGNAYVEFSSREACARAIAKAAAGISHLGRYIEIMPRLQRNDSQPAAHGAPTVAAAPTEASTISSGLARILAAQPKRPLTRNRTPLRDNGANDASTAASGAAPSAGQNSAPPQQRAITPRRGQSDGQVIRLQPWRDPKNAGTPSTHRMPGDVAGRICIGAEFSGQLSPLEDYEREMAWIHHDLAGAEERYKRHQKELSCLTQDKALLDEQVQSLFLLLDFGSLIPLVQVNEETRSRLQRSEERKAQIESLKAAKFNCRRLMLEISRAMPAAALQGDAYRLCAQSDLKAQIKRLQEVGAPCPTAPHRGKSHKKYATCL